MLVLYKSVKYFAKAMLVHVSQALIIEFRLGKGDEKPHMNERKYPSR